MALPVQQMTDDARRVMNDNYLPETRDLGCHVLALASEVERLEAIEAVNVKLLTACKAALLVIRETHVSGCRIELTLEAAIKAATGA